MLRIVGENREVLTRRAPAADLTVAYGPHPEQVADIRLPLGTGPAPLVLLWHGGFWRAEWDRAHVGPVAAALAEHGYAVANVEYRRTGWPATLIDVGEAADRLPALVEDAAPGRVDPTRVVYAGHSAGGQLAIWASLRDRLPAGAPGRTTGQVWHKGVLALAPVVDLADAYWLDLDDGAVEAFLGGGPEEVPERYAAADPAALAAPVDVTVVHGARDGRVPVEMSRRYCAASGSRLVEVAGADHFALIDPESAAWPAVVAALDALT